MKKGVRVKYLRASLILFIISCIMISSGYLVSEAAVNDETANTDIVDGELIRMPRNSTGVVVDGHQLNHD